MPLLRIETTTTAPVDTEADTVAIGVFDGKGVPHDLVGSPLTNLLDNGEARATFKHLAVTHASGKRWILVGLGSRDDFDQERGRVAAATVLGRAREIGTRVLCWELPHRLDDDEAGAFVSGTLLAARRMKPPKEETTDVEALIVSDHDDRSSAVARAEVVARWQNTARDWQERPANVLTPSALAEAARGIAGVEVEVLGRREIEEAGMGAFAAVAQGSDEEPALIVVRYGPQDAPLGLVGKAVTHDTGGYSLKPAASMAAMKFDMSGGATVLAAVGAIAELGLPTGVLAIVGATENMVSGRAIKPGDVVTAKDGTSIEVTNTDAEGRLVLCDCLAYARELGASRLVDIATLTGGVVTALGDVHAGAFANDDAWYATLAAAAATAGERIWRLPLHPDYAKMIDGRYSDIVNSPEARKAHPIVGAEFLHRFVGETPWAHLDIAGVAWDGGAPYAPKGGAGWGVRTLVALAAAG